MCHYIQLSCILEMSSPHVTLNLYDIAYKRIWRTINRRKFVAIAGSPSNFMMRFVAVLMLLVDFACANYFQYPISYLQPSYYNRGYNFFRTDVTDGQYYRNYYSQQESVDLVSARQLAFSTWTVVYSTATATVTSVITTTCTSVPTTAQTACSPNARRRRGRIPSELLDTDDLLFPDTDSDHSDEEILQTLQKSLNSETHYTSLQKIESEVYPSEIGIQPSGRLILFSLGIVTSTTTVFSTTISTLTAACLSTTNFQTCGSLG